jgi:hypothetical protein
VAEEEEAAAGEEDVAAVAEVVEVSKITSRPDNGRVSDLDDRRLFWKQLRSASQQSLVNNSAYYPFQVTTVEQTQHQHNNSLHGDMIPRIFGVWASAF